MISDQIQFGNHRRSVDQILCDVVDSVVRQIERVEDRSILQRIGGKRRQTIVADAEQAKI